MLHAPMDNVTSSMDDVTRSNGQRNDAPIDITRSNGQCNAMCEQIRFTRSNGQFLLLFLFLLLRLIRYMYDWAPNGNLAGNSQILKIH